VSALHTDPEMPEGSDPEGDEPIPLPTWARVAEPQQPIPSHSRDGPPDLVVTSRRRARSQAARYAEASMGHSIGLGYLVLTLRELSGLSQSRLAARAGMSQPAIARLESGRHVPSVNTLLKIAAACGMHLVVGLADPPARCGRPLHARPDAPRVLRPASDELPDFFVIREPPPLGRKDERRVIQTVRIGDG